MRVRALLVLLACACDAPARQNVDSATADTAAGPASTADSVAGPGAVSAGDPGRQESPAATLRVALERMLRGPAADAQVGGAQTWFSDETAGALRSVAVDSIGHAIVDFHDLRPLIPNASSSAGSAMLLEELNATVFGAGDIRSVEYRMDGSCDAFWEWLQYSCQTVTRDFIEE
ncbi:MAG: GerMN domain-containing protein [Gemmatimonadota bacterium]